MEAKVFFEKTRQICNKNSHGMFKGCQTCQLFNHCQGGRLGDVSEEESEELIALVLKYQENDDASEVLSIKELEYKLGETQKLLSNAMKGVEKLREEPDPRDKYPRMVGYLSGTIEHLIEFIG